jgi:hypothetical protein
VIFFKLVSQLVLICIFDIVYFFLFNYLFRIIAFVDQMFNALFIYF